MYHSNPAVIKKQLSQLPQSAFIQEAKFIKQQALSLPLGQRRSMFIRLYGWCRVHYKARWQKRRRTRSAAQ